MSLRDRLRADGAPLLTVLPSAVATADAPPSPGLRPSPAAAGDALPEVGEEIRRELLEQLDFSRLGDLADDELRRQIRGLLEVLIRDKGLRLAEAVRSQVIATVEDELLGLGPLEPLLRDPHISDILVNSHRQVFIERKGKLELTDTVFRNEQHLLRIIERIVSRVGRHCDESSPMVDARLPDGSRVNAIIPPLAIDGPSMSIRRFGNRCVTMNDLLAFGALTPSMTEFLRGAVRARLNIIVAGGTGSGKTTLLNALSAFIPPGERILTIEDSAELKLQQPHVVRLETRPPNVEGKGAVNQRDLVRNALRMRPDRVILGEVRSEEALDMLQAMNTGHDGSMTTLHANSTRDVLSRLETLVLFSGFAIPQRAIREQIASAVNLIVHASRLADGTRKVMSITEIVGMEGEHITTQDIFVYQKEGIGERGQVLGQFAATGIRPVAMDRLTASGIALKPEIFTPGGR